MVKFFSLVLCIVVVFAAVGVADMGRNTSDIEVDTAGNIVDEITPVEVEEPEKILLPFEEGIKFGLSTGIGDWHTSLILDNEGGIYGDFYDNEYGEIGEKYENGTQYWNEYWGFFEEIQKVSEYSYKMFLKDVATSQPTGVEDIDEEEKLRYITTDKITGVVDDTEYILYLPNTPVLELPEEVLTYLPKIESDKDVIDCYMLYSVKEKMVFVNEVEKKLDKIINV